MSGSPPSLSAVRKFVPSTSTSSSSNNTSKKPLSFQRPIERTTVKPPSHEDVDRRQKISDTQPLTVEAGITTKPPSAGGLTHGDNV